MKSRQEQGGHWRILDWERDSSSQADPPKADPGPGYHLLAAGEVRVQIEAPHLPPQHTDGGQ